MESTIDVSAVTGFLNMLTLDKVFSAVIIFLIGLLITKIILRILRGIFKRSDYLDERLEKFILTGVRTVLLIVTLIIVAQSLGIPTTSLVALLSVGALAVSLAVQGMLSNVAGGMTLLTSRIIGLNDLVEVAGVTGTVTEIGLLYTKLQTADGQTVMLPNASISGEKIVNYTTLGRRRVVLSIGASYDAAVSDVREALLEAAAQIGDVHEEPAPYVVVSAYLDSAIEYTIYLWCNWDAYTTVRQTLNERAKEALDRRGIEIPYNHLNVHIMNDSSVKIRTETAQ